MAINEQVYGAKENWYVPGNRTELGHQYSGDAYYYNDIASDDKLKIKVANFNTLSNPVTSFCSQMDGQYPNEGYLIRNNWTATQTDPIDRSIVQFGIGPQSGLADVEWWGVEWITGQSEPTGSEAPSLLNHDKYNIVNIGLGLAVDYVPPMNYTAGSASNLATGDMLITNEQYINRQVWGDEKSYFRTDSSSSYHYHVASGYAFLNFITQIPIKNLKIYPHITAYKSDTQWKQFNSIQDYLAEKNDYPLLGCIEAMFRYRSGVNDTTDYNSSVLITPIFTDKTTVLKGYQNGTDPDKVIRDENLWYSRSWRSHFVVAGRYGYDQSGPHGMMNDIYWVATYDSRPYTYAIFDAVYQTPDFKFTLDANKCFTCDVSNMTNDQITEGIRTQLASFGLFFVDGANDLNLALDDEKTFLGILRNGVGYGDYSNGAKNRDQAQWNWDTMEENVYDPSNPPLPIPDAPTQDDPYSWNSAGTNGANSFRHVYSLSFLNTRNLYNYITSFMNIDTRKLAKNEDLESALDPSLTYKAYSQKTLDSFMRYVETEFTSDPLSCIVDVIMFPFDLPQYLNLSEIEPVILGYSRAKDRAAEDNFGLALTAVGGRPINGNTIAQINLGSEWIIPKFGDFRDYKPYTTIEITIPYHGTVEIDSAEFMSSQLGVIINVDVCTGLSVAYITKNGVPRISIPGNMGIHIPISGINAQNYYNQMVQRGTEIANTKVDKTKATVGMYGSVFSGAMVGAGIGAKLGTVVPGVGNAAGAILGGSVGAVSGLIKSSASYDKTSNNLKAQEYQYEHMQVSPTQVTNYSSELNIFEMPQCRITYHRCIMNSTFNPASYGYSVGWATNKSGTVGSFPGYAKFSNAIIVGNMTEEEKSLILEKLQNGVIVRE